MLTNFASQLARDNRSRLYLVNLIVGCAPTVHGFSTMTSQQSSFPNGGEGHLQITHGFIAVECHHLHLSVCLFMLDVVWSDFGYWRADTLLLLQVGISTWHFNLSIVLWNSWQRGHEASAYRPQHLLTLLYPPEQRSCGGVYWFHSVRPSVRPSLSPSVPPAMSTL